MKYKTLIDKSLKSRVTLFTLGIFTVLFLAMNWYASRVLREEMQSALAERQFQSVSFAAAHLDQQLADRISALDAAGAQFPLGEATGGSSTLANRPVLTSLFNAGVFVVAADGSVLDAYPAGVQVAVADVMQRAELVRLFEDGGTAISSPPLPLDGGEPPLVAMGVPLRRDGTINALLIGLIDLEQPSFIDGITNGSSGQAGGYFLVAIEERLILAASDPARALQPLSAPGENAEIDHFLAGNEGSQIYDNPFGVEVMTSAKRLDQFNWGVAVNIPTAELFAPVASMQRRLLQTFAGVMLLAGVVMWWMLRHELSPLAATAASLLDLSTSANPARQLPVTRSNEIGELITGFNTLLAKLGDREARLLAAHEELSRHRDHLDELVVERTRELAAARDRAEKANRVKTALLANISHELRTPLNHIVGYSYLLSREALGEPAREKVQHVSSAADALLRLVDNVINLAQLEAQELQLQDAPFSLHALLQGQTGRLKPALEAANLQFVIEVADDVPDALRGDALRLGQVVETLLDNAVKFSAAGVITLRCKLEALRGNNVKLRFEVEDQGIGMDAAVIAGLFQAFEQGDGSSTRRHGGTGIGLVLAKRIVELMLGEIGVQSTPGKGSCFWFTAVLAQAGSGQDAMPDVAGRALLQRLAAQLGSDDMAALALARDAAPLLRSILRDHFTQFERALQAYDFSTALALLRQHDKHV